MDAGTLESWLTLFHLTRIPAHLFNGLCHFFGSPAAVLQADTALLARVGVKPELVAAIRDFQDRGPNATLRQKLARDFRWQATAQCHILTLECAAYPPLLKQIPDPPPILYVKGQHEHLAREQIALVGSRAPSLSGRKNARAFATGLARAGYAISSGLALGIDHEGHMGAIEGNSVTLAVLGTGADRIYPRSHKRLAERVVERGALVSEFPLGTGPDAWHFPQRNRIISGLSRGVLVVEAALQSGSLISARFALEQGREVFAIPGSIHNPCARGCHHLIKQGATLVEAVADILTELGNPPAVMAPAATPAQETAVAEHPAGGLSLPCDEALEQKVLAQLGYEPRTLDSLVAGTGLPVNELSAMLMTLELKGRIYSEAAGYSLGQVPAWRGPAV
ncbi:MAG: DNA-processing protein DprA [Pseudomonadales bacterium]|nr:DNA-processing protein DprA [Pseudomonadales bacterium]